ncbi:MAG: hypothetical protein WA657_23170 [Candidatus Acidiferrales bacterium]
MGKTWLEIRTELDGAINDAREYVAAMQQEIIRLEKQKAALREEILSLTPVAQSAVSKNRDSAPDPASGKPTVESVSQEQVASCVGRINSELERYESTLSLAGPYPHYEFTDNAGWRSRPLYAADLLKVVERMKAGESILAITRTL